MTRNIFIDNIKGAAVSLVVVGHFFEITRGGFEISRQLCMLIYIFHMPVFTFLSGFLTGKQQGTTALQRSLCTLLLPYILFQMLLTAIRLAYVPLTAHEIYIFVTTPQYGLWYLFCLVLWRAILPVYLRFPYPLALSFLVGLLWGYCFSSTPYFLSGARLAAFFLFFVLGHHARQQGWGSTWQDLEKKWLYRTIATCILAGACLYAVNFGDQYVLHFQHCRFYAQFQNVHLPAPPVVMRMIAYAMAGAAGLSFLLLLPTQHHPLTRIGERSLYVYLLHLPIMQFLRYSKILSSIRNEVFLIGLIAASIAVAWLLSTDAVQKLAMPFVEPRAFWRNRSQVTGNQQQSSFD